MKRHKNVLPVSIITVINAQRTKLSLKPNHNNFLCTVRLLSIVRKSGWHGGLLGQLTLSPFTFVFKELQSGSLLPSFETNARSLCQYQEKSQWEIVAYMKLQIVFHVCGQTLPFKKDILLCCYWIMMLKLSFQAHIFPLSVCCYLKHFKMPSPVFLRLSGWLHFTDANTLILLANITNPTDQQICHFGHDS